MKTKYILFFIASFLMLSCQKYLDKKPDAALILPTSLSDYNAILENNNIFQSSFPYMPNQSSDDYYLDSNYYLTIANTERAMYIWASDIYQGSSVGDWSRVYSSIYSANLVIEGLQDLQPSSTGDILYKNNIYGRALFVRAFGHLCLEDGWGQPYIPASNATDLGIPLRLNTDLSAKVTRATVKEVFAQIVSDLKQSANLLPTTAQKINFPTKATTYALLARSYLVMQDYVLAGKYADSSLQQKGTLVDYNSLNGIERFPFVVSSTEFAEVLYPATLTASSISILNQLVDTTLYNSYSANDLRKTLFFILNNDNKTYRFRGVYQSGNVTNSPCIDEMYLIRAECNARTGNTAMAMKDLNDLLRTRWKKNTNGTTTYVDQIAVNADDALSKILVERRKELCFRGLRWSDLRRLNQDSKFAITLKRVLGGVTYTLAPNDPKYALQIPPNDVLLSGLIQNKR